MDRPGINLPEWYEIVKDLVDTPLTVVLTTAEHWSDNPAGQLWSDDPREVFESFATELAAMARLVGIGYPAFLRTGLTSGKHDWVRTCHVPNESVLPDHMRAICEYSEMADLIGLPTDTWVLRELMPTRAAFLAFEGMPITRERRYFVVDGKVVGRHPYWPPEAINAPDDPKWPTLLDRLNADNPIDVENLTALTEKVGAAIPGAWSVDWLWVDGRGWVLTDMAWAEQSFVWWEHPDAPQEGSW